MTFSLRAALGWTILAAALSAGAAAQEFPSRPIKLVVPLAAGGGGDTVARLIAADMSQTLGQPVVVENRPGAATVIGSDHVAKAKPDGYTLLLATSSNVINGSLYDLPFDPIADFSGVSLIATSPMILVVNRAVPAKTVDELIAYAKSRPGQLNYASSGNASMPHLCGEMFGRRAGVQMTHVPYKGSGPAEADLLGGHVQAYFSSATAAAGQIKTGKIRPLAITSLERSPAFPDIPTLAETLPGFEANTLYALIAPAATPQAVLDKLNAAAVKAARKPAIARQLADMGADVAASSGSEAMQYLSRQTEQWAAVVKQAGITVQ